MNREPTESQSVANNATVEQILTQLEHEIQWTEHYLWYVETVLVGDYRSLTNDCHRRRRKIEKVVPQAKLAQWAKAIDDPLEAESLFGWMQGRLDFAEHLKEQILGQNQSDLDNPLKNPEKNAENQLDAPPNH
jgi:hypothetical protein